MHYWKSKLTHEMVKTMTLEERKEFRSKEYKAKVGKTLHLNLCWGWFKMVSQRIKLEEYRKISKHYVSLLYDWKKSDYTRGEFVNIAKMVANVAEVGYGDWDIHKFLKQFDTITFSNGYSPDRLQIIIEFKGLEIKEGNPEWGAEAGEKYFVLKLGKIIAEHNFGLCENIDW